jgi:hypothetical protein
MVFWPLGRYACCRGGATKEVAMKRMLGLGVAVALGLGLGCTAASEGSAPTISALTATPSTAPVGEMTTITGMVDFADEDADVMELNVAVRLPDGTRQELPGTDIAMAGGLPAGRVSYVVLLRPPVAGHYVLEVSVRDTNGNESNVLEAGVDAS